MTISRRKLIKNTSVPTILGACGCLRLTQNRQSGSSGGQSGGTNTEIQNVNNTTNRDLEADEIFTTIWQKESDLHPVALNSGYLYGHSRELSKIDASTGDTLWETTVENSRENLHFYEISPTDNHLFLLEDPNPDEGAPPRLFSIDPQTGQERWYFEGELVNWNSSYALTALDDVVIYWENSRSNFDKYVMRAFHANSNKPLWRKEINDGDLNKMILETDILYSFGDDIRVLQRETGKLLQTHEMDAYSGVVTEENIYAGGAEISKLGRSELEVKWEYDPVTRVTGTPIIFPTNQGSSSDSKIVFPIKSGLLCLNTSTGDSKWRLQTTGEVIGSEGLIFSSGLIFTWDRAGFFYVVEAQTGKQLLKSRDKEQGSLSSRLISDGNVVYTSFHSDQNSVLPKGLAALSITEERGSV